MNTISAIIPTYDCAAYLAECLASLDRQNRRPNEIIVVDDGSTDHPEQVVTGFATDIALKFCRHETNRGVQAARQTGLDLATGDLVLAGDADAIYGEDCLGALEQALEAEPSADWAYCDFERLFTETGERGVYHARPWDVPSLREHNYINAASLVRRAAIPPFDLEIKRLTDWDVWLTMADEGRRGVYVPKTLFLSYVRPEGISAQGRYDYLKWRLKVQIKHGIYPRIAVLTIVRDRAEDAGRLYADFSKLGLPFDWYVVGSTANRGGLFDWLKTQQPFRELWVLDGEIDTGPVLNMLRERLIQSEYEFFVKVDPDCDIVSDGILQHLVPLSWFFENKAVLSPRVRGSTQPVAGERQRVGEHVVSTAPQADRCFWLAPFALQRAFRSSPENCRDGSGVEFTRYAEGQGYSILCVEDVKVSRASCPRL
jgi:glycosyltransferase involved in cell wall biosynthesis